ncbi:MAG TPA: hypothetical protein PKY50_06010 [Candidatus Competibacter sp.]|nr:hypothetical protein [Candidatus Competibacter sp.]
MDKKAVNRSAALHVVPTEGSNDFDAFIAACEEISARTFSFVLAEWQGERHLIDPAKPRGQS